METLSTWVTRHRLIVGLLWLAISIGGLVLAPSVPGRLRSGDHFPSPAAAASRQIARQYGGVTSSPGVVTINLPGGQTVHSPGVAAGLRAFDARLAGLAPGARGISYAATGSPVLVGRGGRSTIVLVYPPQRGQQVPPATLTRLAGLARAAVPGAAVSATSADALASGSASAGTSSVLRELLSGAAGALIVLALAFGSFLAVLPLLMAIISVLMMQSVVYLISFVLPSSTPFNPAVQFVVALLGLGLSIDYALLIVSRWGEEHAAGRPNAEVVQAAMKRAGPAVVVSGVTASIGLLALTIVPDSAIRGIGIAGLFIPAAATLVALTLLPAVLATAGPRLDWPRHRSAGRPGRFWVWWSPRVIRGRIPAAILGLGILGALAGVATTINVSQPTAASLARTGPYAAGLRALQADGFPGGTLTTVPVWVPARAQAAPVVTSLAGVASLRGAVSPAGAGWRPGGGALVLVLPSHEVGTSRGGTSLADIRNTVPPGALVGGDAAQSIDQVSAIYGALPLIFGLAALVTLLLLARGLRSLLLAGQAVVLNALSVAAAYGTVVLVFQHGIGTQALWGGSAAGGVSVLVPVLMFGFLFGVSTDYEVFILSRVREGYDRTGSTAGGIVEGVSHTGRLVTSAALILFLAMLSLASAHDPVVRELAAGLAAGVLLDAVVVRMLLLPALVSLFGGANWWLPGWGARLLRVPAAPPAAGPDGDSPGSEPPARPRVPLHVGDA